jgi:hypothetical protein
MSVVEVYSVCGALVYVTVTADTCWLTATRDA